MESLENIPQQRGQPHRERIKLNSIIRKNWPELEGKLFREYLNELVNEGKPAGTVVSCYYRLRKFASICREKSGRQHKLPMDVILLYINKSIIESNVKKLKSKCGSEKYFKDNLSAVRTFYKWLAGRGLIDDDSISYMPKQKSKSTHLTLDYIKQKLPVPAKGVYIADAIEKWFDYNKRLAEVTQRNYHDSILRFIDSLPEGITAIEQLTRTQIRNLLTSMLNDGMKKSSINTFFVGVQSFCRFVSEQYEIENISSKIRRMKPEPSKARFLSWDEYEKVLKVCNNGERQIIEMFGNTGLRVSELVNLRWGNVSADYKMLNVIGKGKKLRYVPCNELVQGILKRYTRLVDTERIQFLNRYDTKYKVTWMCLKLSIKAGIPRFGPHSARHFFATELLRRKVPIAYVSKVLGHSSITTTERLYVHWQPEYLSGITDVLIQERGEQ